MITSNELNSLRLSPTNKDYYQIWTELLETANKLSERWDPSSTNESDPGIVLLKVLTAIADKLNYNIDKNILEAFMPTAAQEDSMRRLCEMLGYNIKYYQSATADVTIKYLGDTHDLSEDNEEKLPPDGLAIPAFTPVTTAEKDLYYLTTRAVLLTNDTPTVSVPCIEGQRIQCETGNSKIIKLSNLDDNNRYYFTERAVAENGIFIYNSSQGHKTTAWRKANNLNTAAAGSKIYMFGFDSKENRPFIQFPSDISFLIEDGLEIYYIRTRGAAGNIQSRSLTVLEKPTSGSWVDYADSEKFSVTNTEAALNGRNPETISQAYNGFKKTIGTFDTLVTCRDYMNKIYQLVDERNVELVSNIVVSDIRDDINRAHTLCSFSDYGIIYIEKANQGDTNPLTALPETLDHFDLLLYPFKTYKNINSTEDYNNSFKYSDANLHLIKAQLEDYKTISHNFLQPQSEEIACIKNYLKLNAKIATQNKVNAAEETLILSNIRAALYNKFNMRELDFGEEIPYDTILACIESADPRIKSVILDEPVLYTKFMTVNGVEYDIGSKNQASSSTNAQLNTAKQLYNKLALRNILAGRVELFNYDNDFRMELGEGAALDTQNNSIPLVSNVTSISAACTKPIKDGQVTLATNEAVRLRAPNFKTIESFSAYVNYYLKLKNTQRTAATAARYLSLGNIWNKPISPKNDEILFANYFFLYLLQRRSDAIRDAIDVISGTDLIVHTRHNDAIATDDATTVIKSAITNFGGVWYYQDENFAYDRYQAKDTSPEDYEKFKDDLIDAMLLDATTVSASHKLTYITSANGTFSPGHYFTAPLHNLAENSNTFIVINSVLESLGTYTGSDLNNSTASDPWTVTDSGVSRYWVNRAVYRRLAANSSRLPGADVDENRYKYMHCDGVPQPAGKGSDARKIYYVQAPWYYVQNDTNSGELTASAWVTRTEDFPHSTSKGIDAIFSTIAPNEEYQLKEDEYLCINYTPSSTTSGSTQQVTGTVSSAPVNKYFGPGTIIRPNETTRLYDSEVQHNELGQSWRKVNGFDFTEHGINCNGMFSVGPNEQIDVRSFVEVTLDDPTIYLFWILNNDVTFTVTKDPITGRPTANSVYSYTLGEGEYLFYTDRHKLDMAYYGSGTEIIFNNNTNLTRTQTFRADAHKINLEEILEGGISAIPWTSYSYGPKTTSLTLREYQYVTLTEGDLLANIQLTGSTNITNDWQAVKTSPGTPISYTIGDTTYDLPVLNVADSTGKTVVWEIRSFLELDVGPDHAQILNPGNTLTVTYIDSENKVQEQIIRVTNDDQALAIKTNVNCQFNGTTPINITNTFGNTIDFKIKCITDTPVSTVTARLNAVALPAQAGTNIDETGIEEAFRDNKQLLAVNDIATGKIFSTDADTYYRNVALYNFNTVWTLLNAENFHNASAVTQNVRNPYYSYITAATTVPSENHYNLMMIYYIPSDGRIPTGTINIDGSTDATKNGEKTYYGGAGFRFYTKNGSADVLDTTCNEIKIFNKYKKHTYTDPVTGQNIAISFFDKIYPANNPNTGRPFNTVDEISFDYIFRNELTWWSYEDVDKNTLATTYWSAPAFGYKQLAYDKPENDTDDMDASAVFMDSVYFLRPGLNMLVYRKSGTFEFFADSENKSVLFLGNIDSILCDNTNAPLGLNLKLINYQQRSNTDIDSVTLQNSDNVNLVTELQLLKDILDKDPNNEFYYNCPMQAASAIDINLNLLNTTDREDLSTPKFWYDTNNINNKFVISQIDTDYLDKGLTLAKSSKLFG